MRLFDQLANRLGYVPKPVDVLEKAVGQREAIAQNPLQQAYQAMSLQSGLRKSSGITMQTLRRMSRYNWVDRTCIFTLRDEITALPWDIVPIDPHKPYDTTFQQIMVALLNRPNRNNENFRTFWDKVVEDILVLDSGTIEKVRNDHGQVVELWTVDGSTIKPLFDTHGVVGDPAYQQFMVDKLGNTTGEPVAEWDNEDMVYIRWNPQDTIDNYGWGLSPVEAGLAVGTQFLYAEAYNLGFFRQNTMPPMLINMGKDMQPAQVTMFQQWLAAEMMGPNGYWKPIIGSFGEGFDVKQLLKAPNEMGFKDYVEWQMKWKVALYRMSPQDIGFTLDQYKAEGQVQQQLSKNKAINSLSGVLADYINREILGDEAYKPYNANLKFDWLKTDAIDPVDQSTIDKTYIMTGVKTPNEVRQSQGLDPVDGGDELLLVAGSTVMPLKSVDTNNQIQQTSQLAALKQGTPVQKTDDGLSRYDYQSTQLDLPEDVSRQVRALGEAIPNSAIALDPTTRTYGREQDIHVTVLYGLSDTVTAEQVAAVAEGFGPITITLGMTSLFETEDCDVLKIDVESPALEKLHAKLRKALGAPGYTFPTYQPHVTIAYLKTGQGVIYTGIRSLEGQTITFSTLRFCDTQGRKVSIPLTTDSGVQKSFSPQEGLITDLSTNQTAIAWMDDRGVTQPFFVTDYGKSKGFAVKPAFLDERKDQEPPEQKVAELLRSIKANTPQVQILSYDEVIRLMPAQILDQFTAYLKVEAPFYSKEWLDRWGTTRQSPYYIVTGYLTGTDLGNDGLQRAMMTSPESYLGAVKDLARVWLGERTWYLGDRKPGHYLITTAGSGFGVDYQFYEDQNSWEKTAHFLPRTLAIIHPSLFYAFKQAVEQLQPEFGMLEKAFGRAAPDKWTGMAELTDIERRLAADAQKRLRAWYKLAVHGARGGVHKALPIVNNPDAQAAFIDGNQVRHPVLGQPAFISHGELLPAILLPIIDALFGAVAQLTSEGQTLNMPELADEGTHQDLPTAIALATQAQGQHPLCAYLVAVAPDGMGKSQYRIFRYGEGGV